MNLDDKKKKLELSRVKLAREEMEFRIEERLDEIEKLREHIKVQVAREAELEKDVK